MPGLVGFGGRFIPGFGGLAIPGNSRSFRFALALESGMDEDDSDWLAENENPLKISG